MKVEMSSKKAKIEKRNGMQEGLHVSIPQGQRFFNGDKVWAKYREDGQWYLAQVLNSDGHRGARVVFIQYGNEQDCVGEELQRVVEEKTEKDKTKRVDAKSAASDAPKKATVAEALTDYVPDDLDLGSLVDSIALSDVAPISRPAGGSGAALRGANEGRPTSLQGADLVEIAENEAKQRKEQQHRDHAVAGAGGGGVVRQGQQLRSMMRDGKIEAAGHKAADGDVHHNGLTGPIVASAQVSAATGGVVREGQQFRHAMQETRHQPQVTSSMAVGNSGALPRPIKALPKAESSDSEEEPSE